MWWGMKHLCYNAWQGLPVHFSVVHVLSPSTSKNAFWLNVLHFFFNNTLWDDVTRGRFLAKPEMYLFIIYWIFFQKKQSPYNFKTILPYNLNLSSKCLFNAKWHDQQLKCNPVFFSFLIHNEQQKQALPLCCTTKHNPLKFLSLLGSL